MTNFPAGNCSNISREINFQLVKTIKLEKQIFEKPVSEFYSKGM